MINYLRYNQQTVESIGKGLETYNNASELAKTLNVDVSGLIKHIKKYLTIRETTSFNMCGRKYSCISLIYVKIVLILYIEKIPKNVVTVRNVVVVNYALCLPHSFNVIDYVSSHTLAKDAINQSVVI